MEELLNCVNCNLKFDRKNWIPRDLDCKHVCCEECIQRLIINNQPY